MESKTETTSKSWLQRLKDESWEAELLVSAVAIFGTFQLFNVIDWMTNKFIDILDPNQYLIGYGIVFLGLFAISILASMFVIHFFLRSYWIGLVGLNSVFPDYSVKDSAYSEIYTKKVLSILPKLKDSIQKVDDLCSVIFSSAFTFLLIYMYMAFSTSLYLLIFNLLSDFIPKEILLIPIIGLILLITVQAVIGIIANLKKNHNKENLQLWQFKIMKIASIVTYGPLYRSILQVTMIFGSNFKKNKKLVYLNLIFVISGVFLTIYQMLNTNIPYLIDQKKFFSSTKTHASYYEKNNTLNTFLLNPEIESDITKSKIIKIFIPLFSHEKKSRKEICNYSDNELSQEQKDLALLNCYKAFNEIFVNDNQQKADFLRYIHPRTKQFGVICYIEANNLTSGKNILEVKKGSGIQWKIPFYFFDQK